MPRYEYECPKCNAVVEVQCPIAERDSQVLACPANCTETVQNEFSGDDTEIGVRMKRRVSAPSGSFPGASSWRS